jgi:hypothetical protein
VRKPHLRCAYMKNGDAQITHLHHRVLHYRVIRDARPCASLISTQWRRAKLTCVSHCKTHPRCALRVRVTDLTADWGPMALVREAPGVFCLPLLRNLRHTLYYSVADLIASWGHCATNKRCIVLDARLFHE